MARGIWKGSIAFGLVEVPVVLQAAVRSDDLRFTQLDRRDHAPVGYRHYNKNTGEEVAWEDVVKGYEYEKGRFVVLSDKDFERADRKASRTVEIVQFVDAASIAPVYFDTPYYVAPQHANSRSYALLREALVRTKKVGIARVVVRTREHLAALLPRGKLLAIDLLRFDHEVKKPSDIEVPEQDEKALKPKDAEVAMATQLIEGMSAEWEPEKFRDRYRDAVLEMVKKKVKSGKTAVVEEAEEEEPRAAADVYDLMPLLKESVKARAKGRKSVAAEREPRRAAGKTTGPARPRRKTA